MPAGGTLTITTRSLSAPRDPGRPTHVTVEFQDTGPGMTEEQRRRAFTTVLRTTKTTGTGLGLAIVGRIIETHHGELAINSPPGGGATVTILLPVCPTTT
jgi:signal transduction histidine kinase